MEFLIGQGVGDVKVAHPARGHPDFGLGVVDNARGGPGKTHEQAALDGNEDHRKDHAGQRDGQAHAVVQEIAQGDANDHGQGVVLERITGSWRYRILARR